MVHGTVVVSLEITADCGYALERVPCPSPMEFPRFPRASAAAVDAGVTPSGALYSPILRKISKSANILQNCTKILSFKIAVCYQLLFLPTAIYKYMYTSIPKMMGF